MTGRRDERTMRVAELVDIGRVAVRTAPVPAPGPGEARLRVRAVGLCGTDVKAFRRGHPYFKPPCVLGHEVVGTIDALGHGAHVPAPGTRVVCAPYVECGVCALCRRGVGELCAAKSFVAGALQEYLILPPDVLARATFPLPDSVRDDLATLAEPLACAMNGVERAGVRAGDRVLIVGGGPMGALLALLAGAVTSHVVVSEVEPRRAARLAELGLRVTQPSGRPLEQELADAWGAPEADRVLIAVGDRGVVEEAIRRVAPGGSALVFGGLPKGDALSIDAFAVHYREVSIVGSFGFQIRHFREAVAWIAAHPGALDGVVTRWVPFSAVADAFARAGDPDGLKTVVVFDGDETR